MRALLGDIKITRCMNAVVAGTTDQNGAELDMQGYDGVLLIAAFGAITATAVTGLKAQQDTATGMASAADLLGTLVSIADDEDDGVLVLDIFRPEERFIRGVITRATANVVIEGLTAVQYRGRTQPETQDATVRASETHVTPAEGTA